MLAVKRVETAMGVPYYEHKDKTYRRIAGGIGWPGEKPGFACLIGESGQLRPPFTYYVLLEAEEEDLGTLLKKCRDIKREYMVGEFYARDDEEMIANYLSHWNSQEHAAGLKGFWTAMPPFCEDGKLGYHITMVKEALRKTNKTLFLGKESRLPGYFMEIPALFKDALDTDYPAVAALAYAYTALKTSDTLDPDLGQGRKAKTTDVMARLRGKK